MFSNFRTVALAVFLLSIHSRIKCNAQLLSAYEQAYGHWGIKLSNHLLSGRKWHLHTPDDGNDKDDGKNKLRKTRSGRRKIEEGDLQLLFPEVPRSGNDTIHTSSKSVRSVSCILNLEKNGKFSLILAEDGGDPFHNSSTITHHQPLTGEWFLTPNPYCVTGRHYDTLLLVSEPRMRRRSDTVERATVELRCKLWGRYGGGGVRRTIGLKHGRIRGRMSHGSILIVKEDSQGGNARKNREVVGTFGGKTLEDSEVLESRGSVIDKSDESKTINDDDDCFESEDVDDEFDVI